MKRRYIQITALCAILVLFEGCARRIDYNLNEDGYRVSTGLERFVFWSAKRYRGKKAALVTNHSGYDYRLRQNIELLRGKGIVISMILEPEHGIYGYRNDTDFRASWYDPIAGSRVYSLYGIDPRVLKNLLASVDIVIFDIQDMGMRCYTYISNLKEIIDALDGTDRLLIVLDRPNPVGFLGVDGAFLDRRFASRYVSAFPAPLLYNMTIGEAARYYRGEFRPKVKLKVVRMGRYRRGMLFHKTGLPWVPPSPNLPTYESSIAYTAVVLMEGINLSIGRGTAKPFEYIGAPWIEPFEFCKTMNALDLPNFKFKPVYFVPSFSKYANMRCGGAQLFYTGGKFSPTEAAYRMIGAIMKRYPYYARWAVYGGRFDIDTLAGTDLFRLGIQEGKPWKEFVRRTSKKNRTYRRKRCKYLLY
ncbi:MAG: DUF1343 domain-containing protein [Spirochaetes bacterium]|nr:DUF1343 domain-containing protein [Spirochaetota bacterium]